MELKLIRKTFLPDRTLSELYVNGVFECYVLEDVDRGLKSSMSLKKIQAIKVMHQTCIPYGTYDVIITPSVRFKRDLPLLVDVPGYSGIRIHPGNRPEDTSGCLLPGQAIVKTQIGNSRLAFNALFDKLKAVPTDEKITITITK